MSKFFKTRKTRAWFITAVSITALVVVADCVAFNPNLASVLDTVTPAKPITKGGGEAYTKTTSSKAEAKQNSNNVNEKIGDEGFVLLKNKSNALPLKAGAKISVFGKNSVSLVYGTSGSGASNNDEAVTVHDSLTKAGFEVNPTLEAFYKDNKKSGEGRPKSPAIENGGNVDLYSGETPIANYTSDITNSYADYKDAALIVISRVSGEGYDLPMSLKRDPTKHYLELDKDELALVKHVEEQGFSKIIFYFNCNNQMEVGDLVKDDKVDAILWAGGLGDTGASALGRILSGEVNPSGHLPDTWERDFTKNPTYQNFSDNRVSDGNAYTEDGTVTLHTFVDEEESIYVGYRYFETRGETDSDWYSQNVVFPFGFGLSYTTFDWEVTNKSELEGQAINITDKYEVKVKVTNTGEKAGKDVVEIYAALPYTNGSIEKSSEVLAAFAKTDLLEPGASQELTLEVNPYYFASYDYSDADKDSFSGYELEKGTYQFRVSSDAHTVKDTITLPALETTLHYENDPVTGTKVENRFNDIDDHLQSLLSRSSWDTTFPVSPTDDQRNVYWILDHMKDDNGEDLDVEALDDDVKTKNPIKVDTMPTQGQVTGTVEDTDENGNTIQRAYKISDLAGASYDDPRWEDLLNQISVSEMDNMFQYASFWTQPIASISKEMSYQSDGPAGFTNFMVPDIFTGCASISNGPVIASTWNRELVEELGEAIGEEGLQGYNGVPYSGWYAPGMNLHRCEFGGRNGEYYSEDPLLTGKIAASLVTGCKSKGVHCYIKHFVANEQETDRAGIDTWMSEQALRELYLRPFEICVKEAGSMAIMTSFNRIGTTWTGGDYRLLTQVLREEWGFHGCVICDFNTNPHMNTREMAYAGGDLNLATQAKEWVDANDPTDVTVLRNCTKNTLYMLVNSNFVNSEIIGYTMPMWRMLVAIIEPILFVGLAVWGVIVIVLTYKKTPGEKKDDSKVN